MLHKLQLASPTSPVDVTWSSSTRTGRPQCPAARTTFAAAGNADDTAVTLTFAGTAPNIRRGTWILDTSYDPV